ncbi:1-acyl-sn-glycerol-3-phosphate acyltransferase [Aeromicrobium sp. 636]|uniref:1-acyl-sn-glycerol-3-phosphate acyltransferase n=1 Tax=Aeromicrobium senzhongii TaxID=2663859 RepID=A0A8I0K213_9ACTN|nr:MULTISPECIES: lysophospholipid acyltransferase family protein [Aeromicrobium]MBC9225594.1 1-acyl-sn-glycerol-3-phosphate acyltransferase [Aeromicrobium senzhongii]MCQ3997703.1 1-acyl-sn-glycerol-3-phosphate acyltransferase [Aeromicrobium sp. 636]
MSRTRPLPPVLRVVVWILRPIFMVVTRRDWRGDEHLPTSGGYVIAANHLSYTDPFLLGHWLVDHDIPPRFLVKDPLFAVPVIGRLLRMAEQIPVYRGTGLAAESLRAAIHAAASGSIVTIYPEGTMTRDPQGWPMSGRDGAVRTAHAAGVPLVPVAQWGPQEIMWPYRREFRLFPRKTIHVFAGAPIDLSDLGDHPTQAQFHAATDRLMDAITALQSQIRGEVPTSPRIDVRTLGKPKTRYEES